MIINILMKVLILEVCRSPEIMKVTAPMILSYLFMEQKIDYKIFSNDGIWSDRTIFNKNLFKKILNETEFDIVHLAMHGNDQGLVLKWSDDEYIENRVVEDLLVASDIEMMRCWKGKLIVSGACATAKLAPAFLNAGAKGVIAPENVIIWTNMGHFFRDFYGSLFSGQDVKSALSLATSKFPELESYRFFKI